MTNSTAKSLTLNWSWQDTPSGNGRLRFEVANLGARAIAAPVLHVSMLTRLTDAAQVQGASYLGRTANHHKFALGALAAGATCNFTATGLSFLPKHATDGPKSAYIDAEGAVLPVAITPDPDHIPARAHKAPTPNTPLGVTPWPAEVAITAWHDRPAEIAPDHADADYLAAQALRVRLFGQPAPLPRIALEIGQKALPPSHYEIEFTPTKVTLFAGDDAARWQGLVTLMQMVHAAQSAPAIFKLPARGAIKDHPQQGWRGAHLDVARHFMPSDDLHRFVDCLAWLKLNRLHLHLTDDEGWRLEVPALPALTQIGAWRGPDLPLIGQHGFLPARYGGYYTGAQMSALVDHARALNIEIMPEIDTPGHCHAALVACPWLRDPAEPMDAYTSFQGYPNNALNPGMADTWQFLETVLEEVTRVFPFEVIHIGGDELAETAWARSPAAGQLAPQDHAGRFRHFMQRASALVQAAGRKTAVWDDAALVGAVDPEAALVFAWQNEADIARLAGQGFEIVAMPGQAAYLDMAQSDDWLEPGLHWGGTVPAQVTHGYDPLAGLDAAARGRILGVQAGIWSENLITRDLFNHLVFPRLGALAEAAWAAETPRDYASFAARAPLLPQM